MMIRWIVMVMGLTTMAMGSAFALAEAVQAPQSEGSDQRTGKIQT